MEISFRLEGDIQIVAIAGIIGERETAAIRFKIDEKINIGRNKFCFDLSTVTQAADSFSPYLLELLDFCRNRSVSFVLCGASQELRNALIPASKKALSFFESVPEGVAFLKTEKPSADLKGPGNAEEAEKSRALAALIEKYRGFWKEPDDDPLRIKFSLEQYHRKPADQWTKDELADLLRLKEKAEKLTADLTERHSALDQEISILDAKVAKSMFSRKLPRNAEEESLQTTSISRETDQLNREMQSAESEKAHLTEALKKLEKARIEANKIAKESEDQWKKEFESFKKSLQDDLEKKREEDKKAEADFLNEKLKLEEEIKSKQQPS